MLIMIIPVKCSFVLVLVSLLCACIKDEVAGTQVHHLDDGMYLLHNQDGRQLKITAYGKNMVRMQTARPGEAFLPDDHYEMVANHNWSRHFDFRETGGSYQFSTASGLTVIVDPDTLTAKYRLGGVSLLSEKAPVQWDGTSIKATFNYQGEHFTGLGHGFYARESSVDLKGKVIRRNYGDDQKEQAPLIVPFYMSSKGYGVFLNSTFENTFSFGAQGEYSMAIDDRGFGGQMDYFFIAGTQLKKVLSRYTQLTGRPRLPPKAMFGLQLSDKGHDHTSATPSDEAWWKAKIQAHRDAGYPLDHVINDNRWRAAGGKRCESKLEWDAARYPDPAAYGRWLAESGLVATLDFNRCIARFSDGWKAEFNLPETGEIDFNQSAPDLTDPEFRKWFWELFYRKSLDPELQYPGSALWIDEFDEQGGAPKDMILHNGRSAAEMRNYWFFLIAKALVQQGWDTSDINRRPFVWVRGMTAGAQRYATLWSGDIYPSYEDMKHQIRGMQLAGLSGFPFWGHDAGGFFDWENGVGPDENMYIQWAMAMGSVAPIWKPHGMGQSRWPLDRSERAQGFAHRFSRMRYELMPYIYAAAHRAAARGLPMARAMLLDYQDEANAWKYDLQYMWGKHLLVAPNASDGDKVDVWLPWGNWYDYETKAIMKGNRVISVDAPVGKLPIFVREGAVIPRREYANSTAFINKNKLIVDVYSGGSLDHADIVEDDEISEDFRDGKKSLTRTSYNHGQRFIRIKSTQKNYDFVPETRDYQINIYGTNVFDCAEINTVVTQGVKSDTHTTFHINGWPARDPIHIKPCSFPPAGGVSAQC